MYKKILIIEDDIGICKLLKAYLEHNSFKTDIKRNGRTGLMNALNINYDLIILDILIPDLDGFHVLSKLREIKSTPVMMLSAQDDEKVMDFCLQSGANDYVVKPFNCKRMVEKVKELVN